MVRSRARAAGIGIAAALFATAVAACRSTASQIPQHREKLESLAASARGIGDAWLAGSTSRRYTESALIQTFNLLEKERHAFAAAPDALLDARGADLSQASERLARVLAAMIGDVRASDARSLKEHLAALGSPQWTRR